MHSAIFYKKQIYRHHITRSLPSVINTQVLNLDQNTISTGTFKYKPDICVSMPICTSTEQCKNTKFIPETSQLLVPSSPFWFSPLLSVTFCSPHHSSDNILSTTGKMWDISTARCIVIHQHEQHKTHGHTVCAHLVKEKKKEIWHSVEFLAAHNLNAWFWKQPDKWILQC